MFFGDSYYCEERQNPFPLEKLPADILFNCLEKLKFKNWLILREGSKFSNSVCDSLPSRVICDVNTITVTKRVKVFPRFEISDLRYVKCLPWREATKRPIRLRSKFLTIKCRLTNERLAVLQKMFGFKQVICPKVTVEELMDCSGEEFIRFLEVVGAHTLEAKTYVPPEIFDFSYARNLRWITMDSCRLNDRQFLSIDALILDIKGDSLSTAAICDYVREWKEGKREFDNLKIRFDTLAARAYDNLLQDLNANLIWSPSSHDQSLIHKLKINDIREMWTDDPRSYYCIFRSSNIKQRRLLKLNREYFEICTLYYETDVFSRMLSSDQYSSVFIY